MRVFSRIGLVSASVFLGLLAESSRAQDTPTRHPVISVSTNEPFNIQDAAGRLLALHFLGAASDHAARHVNEYLRNLPRAAGVRHAFICTGDAESVKAWAASFEDHAGMVYIDPDAALARDLAVKAESPTTILFGTDGKELHRWAGSSPDDHLAWAAFAAAVSEKTRATALKDYNLDAKQPIAVEGYDVVSYIKAGKAAKGKREIVSTYRGVTYQFSTEEHRAIFAADPERYLPTYGGWCASAMGDKGTKVEISPTNFKVKDGRLFLFYKGTFSNALTDWNKHEREWEPAADANWKKLTGEDPIKPVK